MKKSLLIRWLIILVIVGGWCYSIFPVKDRDFLSEFMRLSKKTVATLEKHVEKATALQQKLEALPNQSGKDYEALQADIKKIRIGVLVDKTAQAAVNTDIDYEYAMTREEQAAAKKAAKATLPQEENDNSGDTGDSDEPLPDVGE